MTRTAKRLTTLTAVVALLAVTLLGTTTGRAARAAFPGTPGALAFSSDRGGLEHNIFRMDADGFVQTQLTNVPSFHAFAPTWSSNGKKIAYYLTDGDGCGIYEMNANGSGTTPLTSS